jgi:NADH:ubiquinone oxidoreductase subunit E
MAKTNIEMFTELEEFITSVGNSSNELIAILHKAQSIFGYLPKEVQEFIAKKVGVSTAKVYGVVTFYSFFTMVPKGEIVINVCMGTACFVRGADKILEKIEQRLGIKNGQTSSDNRYTLTTLRCVGACGLAPVVQINGKTFGNCTPASIDAVLNNYK